MRNEARSAVIELLASFIFAMPPKTLQTLILELTSCDEEQAIAAVDQIIARGQEALPILRQMAVSPDANTRWWALRVLAAFSHPDVPPILQAALMDPDYTVRQCAALGLSQQADPAAIPALIAALSDKDRLVARLAGDALIAVGGPAVTDLITTLETGSSAAQIEAARALGVIGDTRAIPAMFAAWEDGSALVRHWIEQGFERMGVGMQFFTPE